MPGVEDQFAKKFTADEFSDDFIRGQKDCKEGYACNPDYSDAYDRGYAAQYELEQIQSEMNKNEHH